MMISPTNSLSKLSKNIKISKTNSIRALQVPWLNNNDKNGWKIKPEDLTSSYLYFYLLAIIELAKNW